MIRKKLDRARRGRWGLTAARRVTGSPPAPVPPGHADSSGDARGSPSDPGHGGEGAGDGCAGVMPTARWPGRGGAGRSSGAGPGIASGPAPVAGINRDTVRAPAADAGRRQAPGSEAPGRRLMPAAQPARSAGTPPGDDDLDAAAAHPGQGGSRQPALPAGQQPSRGALATGHVGPRRAPARRAGKGSHRPGRTTGTDRRQRPRLPTASRLTGPKDRSFPRVTVGEAGLPGAHTCRIE